MHLLKQERVFTFKPGIIQCKGPVCGGHPVQCIIMRRNKWDKYETYLLISYLSDEETKQAR